MPRKIHSSRFQSSANQFTNLHEFHIVWVCDSLLLLRMLLLFIGANWVWCGQRRNGEKRNTISQYKQSDNGHSDRAVHNISNHFVYQHQSRIVLLLLLNFSKLFSSQNLLCDFVFISWFRKEFYRLTMTSGTNVRSVYFFLSIQRRNENKKELMCICVSAIKLLTTLKDINLYVIFVIDKLWICWYRKMLLFFLTQLLNDMIHPPGIPFKFRYQIWMQAIQTHKGVENKESQTKRIEMVLCFEFQSKEII